MWPMSLETALPFVSAELARAEVLFRGSLSPCVSLALSLCLSGSPCQPLPVVICLSLDLSLCVFSHLFFSRLTNGSISHGFSKKHRPFVSNAIHHEHH